MPFQTFGPVPLNSTATLTGWGTELRLGVTAVFGGMRVTAPLEHDMQESLPGLALYFPSCGETDIEAPPLKQPLKIKPGYAYAYSAEASAFRASMPRIGTYSGLKLFFSADSLDGITTQAALSYIANPKQRVFAQIPLGRDGQKRLQDLPDEPPQGLQHELGALALINDITASTLQAWHMLEADQTETSTDRAARLVRADDSLKTHLIAPPTVITLANTVGLNHMTLKRGFRRKFGTTVYGRLRYWRMQRAQSLLQSGASVTDTALEVGYSNPSKFAAAFRRETGQNPSQIQHEVG